MSGRIQISPLSRIGLGFLLVLLLVAAFALNRGTGILLAVVLFPLLIAASSGTLKRNLFLSYVWFLLVLPLRVVLTALLVSPGAPSERTLRILVSLVSPLLALGIEIGTVLGLIYVASEWVLNMSQHLGVTRSQAMRTLASQILGVQYAYQIIKGEEVTISSPGDTMSTLGGPGLLIVRPGSAAVLEWGSTTSRIVGPSVIQTAQFERVKEAVDLRPQYSTVTADYILTRDGVPLRLGAKVCYQIEPLAVTKKYLGADEEPSGPFDGTIEGAHPVHLSSVFKAVYMSGPASWRNMTIETVDLALRQALGQRALVEIFSPPQISPPEDSALNLQPPPTVISDLEQEVANAANSQVREWGAYITSINIAFLEPPELVREQLLELWKTEAYKESLHAKVQAVAEEANAVETVNLAVRATRMQDLDTVLKTLEKHGLLSDVDGSSLAAILQVLYQPAGPPQPANSETQLDVVWQKLDSLSEALSATIASPTRTPEPRGSEYRADDSRVVDRLKYLEEKFEELRQDFQVARQYEQSERAIHWTIRGIIIAAIISLIGIMAAGWPQIVQLFSSIR